MERTDAEQEGITLPPQSTTRLIARDEAERAIQQHLRLCPLATLKVEDRLRGVEISLARLIGFMLGSGLLGGTAGALITKLIH